MYLYIRRTEVRLLFSVTMAIPPRVDLNIKISTLGLCSSCSPVEVQVVVSPGDPLRLLGCGQGGAGQVDVTPLLNKNISVAMYFCLNTIDLLLLFVRYSYFHTKILPTIQLYEPLWTRKQHEAVRTICSNIKLKGFLKLKVGFQ